MRAQGYRLFEIVAWPAAAWYLAEALIRTAEGDVRGAGWAALLAAMAAGMIAGSRMASGCSIGPRSAGRPGPS